jgi:hypothetical protein
MTPYLFYLYYPVLLALLGAIAATIVSRRMLRGLSSDEKAVLLDSFARGRVAVLSMVVIVVALLLWRPFVAWVFFAVAEVCLFGFSWLRLGRLQISPSTAKTLRVAQLLQTIGFVVFAAIFAARSA